jgi:hypothetical protein
VAATPTTGFCSHCTCRVTPDAAGCPRVSGTWTACRTAAAEVAGSGCGKSAPVPAVPPGVAMHTDNVHLAWPGPWPAVAVVPGRVSGCAPGELPCPRWLPQGPRRVRAGGRRAVGAGHPSKGSDRRRHHHGHRMQPVRVCRTPAVRTAVVPEAADGQSADGSGSLQLPLLFLKAGHRGTGLTLPPGDLAPAALDSAV